MILDPWRKVAADVAALRAAAPGVENLPLQRSSGRVLASPVQAIRPIPDETHAVMDGFALGAWPPGRFRLSSVVDERLATDAAVSVVAGSPIPEGAACVALARKVEIDGDRLVVREAQRRDNIRRAGEEAGAGEVILAAGLRLDARHLALAAAAGIRSLSVLRRPSVALLALHEGDDALPHAGILAALLDSPALAFADAGSVRGAALTRELARLAELHDLVIVVAESLDGEDGPLAAALSASGGRCEVLRAALKPAKPVVTGTLGGAAIIGLAGTAYAATIAAHLFLRPLLRTMLGLPPDDPFLDAIAAFARDREPGRAESLPVSARRAAAGLALSSAGRFGRLSALAAMDGFALVEAEAGPIEPGSPLLYHPLAMPLV